MTPKLKQVGNLKLRQLEASGIPQIYNEFRLSAQRTLGLPIDELRSFETVKEVFARQGNEGNKTVQFRK